MRSDSRRGLALAALVVVLAGCGSPEAQRARGQGPGADVGNEGDGVRLHESTDPYWRTPRLLPAPGDVAEAPRRASRASGR
jgi:hypothetical protein